MNSLGQRAVAAWFNLGPRFLPFADAATPELPLGRLLRLSLFQVSVGVALVLLVGTLNRVMIVELSVPASLVGIMISLPLLFAPFRALVGFKSDNHVSALGWRRVPYIWRGTLLQFGGLAVMPFALLVLAKQGQSASAPIWLGHGSAALAFLMVGAGVHMVQTVGLALATDLAPTESQPKVVGLMYVMLLVGMILAAFVYGWALADYSNGRLVQVIQASALLTAALNLIALWKQEPRDRNAASRPRPRDPTFMESWNRFVATDDAVLRLVAVGFGTMAFGMADVVLEPYGGQILGLTVADTTRLTATLAGGTLIGFALASRVLGRGGDPVAMAAKGALVGVPGFAAIILASTMASPGLFALGTLLIGFGAGLFGHGTLTATMRGAPADQVGLALGAWGAVQATAGGLGVALGGVIRDVVAGSSLQAAHGPATGYIAVFGIEMALLAATLLAMLALVRRAWARAAQARPA